MNIGLIAYGIGAISDAVGHLGAEQDRVFHAREYQIFNQSLDETVAGAIEEFARQERAEVRLEESKRTGYIAHELRNALSTARLAYSTLKRGTAGINSNTGDLLGRGLLAVENLVRQMMAAVQLESGSPIERRPIAVSEVFKNLEEATLASRGIVIHWEAEPDMSVTADERLLNTSLMNLLQNGLKFTRDRGTVTVRARREGVWTVLEVEDECGGLPPGKEASLFAPFVQEGADRSGLGLGLPITREATEAQGGRLVVHNLPGHGCIFAVELPAA
jgi:signal transduction histidine kinase